MLTPNQNSIYLESSPPKDSLEVFMSNKQLNKKRNSTNPEGTRDLNLLKGVRLEPQREIKHVKYGGHIKIPTVHNDYHSFSSNMGYSRSETGGIFPK